MFTSISCSFSPRAKFKDKFIFNGGQVDSFCGSMKIISESEASLEQADVVFDWWILDSIQLKRVLPFEWYRPLSDNPFLAAFRFHFFSLDLEDTEIIADEDVEDDLPFDLIVSLVKRFGASVSDSIDPLTTHIITQFQCEHLLPTQLLGPVQFVTISWIVKVLSAGKYLEPSDAIDYPCPIHPIPESTSLNVCLSGFNSSERKLISAQLFLMGITISPNFSPSVSLLICNQRRLEGPKFEMALQKGIKIVQKSWVDECYRPLLLNTLTLTYFMVSEEELIELGICFQSQKDPTTGTSKPIHAPINQSPTPFSSRAFSRAQQLQSAFNLLVLRTVQNRKLIGSVCGKLAEGDEFVGKLFEIYRKYPEIPKIFFNVNRSDYMVEGDEIFQIELNTISASLAGLSTKLADFFLKSRHETPRNKALSIIGGAFDRAVQIYQEEYSTVKQQCAVLFIVQEDERNCYDQAHLRDSINPAIPILNRSLRDPEVFQMSESDDGILTVDGHEIAVVYYRAGYSPVEYLTPEFWKSRDILESSRAIKCPDIAAHLAGLKKIQQVLTCPQLLLETMRNDAQITRELLSTFAGIYSLDGGEEGERNAQMACDDPEKFVLKPQREGGGNNFYGQDIPSALKSMSPSERSTFILMDRIRPTVSPALILRDGKTSQVEAAVSELGIYGVILARTGSDSIVLNEEAGWLLRTKPVESDEGGVVSGYSVLDVPKLI